MPNVTPWLPERNLEDPLVELVVAAEGAGLEVILPALEESYDEGLSSLEETAAVIAVLLAGEEIRRRWRAAADESAGRASEFWLREAARAGIASQVRNSRPPEKLLEDWMAPAVELHERLRDNVAEETRLAIEAAMAGGMASQTLAKDFDLHGLPSTNGRMRGRGRVIAADQLVTLGALIAAFHQKDAGILEFIWQTRKDSRVRDEHRYLQGERFKWAEPPSEGLPGEPVACRCWAEGVVEEPEPEPG